MARGMRVLVVWLVLVIAHASARADEVGLVVSGGNGATLHGDVEKHLGRWLKKRNFKVSATALDDDGITTIANCLVISDTKCASGVVDARSKNASVVFMKIDATPDKNITFTLYWFVKGHEGTGEQRVCEKCAGDTWRPMADKMMLALRGAVGDAVKPEPKIEKPIEVQPGGGGGSHVVPAFLLGGGVAALGVSAVQFWYGSKSGSTERYTYEDSTSWGIAFAAVGVGLTLGGAILWHEASTSSAPVAAFDAHGGYVGWITRF
jgi:hypothetical protein